MRTSVRLANASVIKIWRLLNFFTTFMNIKYVVINNCFILKSLPCKYFSREIKFSAYDMSRLVFNRNVYMWRWYISRSGVYMNLLVCSKLYWYSTLTLYLFKLPNNYFTKLQLKIRYTLQIATLEIKIQNNVNKLVLKHHLYIFNSLFPC